MLHKTKGIIINFIPYRETSIIAKVYTEEFGIQTYIENGIRSSRGKNKMALFQPATLLELVVYMNPKKEIQRISEIKCSHPYETLPYHILKSSIALFIMEILHKSLQEESENKPLFNFLNQTFIDLDTATGDFENTHLQFLLNFAFYLGFAPQTAKEIDSQFSENGVPIMLSPEIENALNQLIRGDNPTEINMNRTLRNELLNILLAFYRLHIENLSEVKSMTVLREVLG
jgi:DNA repair protein RecO (recombination protein O)